MKTFIIIYSLLLLCISILVIIGFRNDYNYKLEHMRSSLIQEHLLQINSDLIEYLDSNLESFTEQMNNITDTYNRIQEITTKLEDSLLKLNKDFEKLEDLWRLSE